MKSLANKSAWKANQEGYQYPHHWMYRNFGKASRCEKAETGCTGKSIAYQWANISGDYKKDRTDWMELCASCHKKMDYTDETRRLNAIHKKGNSYARRVEVAKYSSDGTELTRYESMHEAARQTGVLVTSIQNVTSGRSKTAGGFIWRSI